MEIKNGTYKYSLHLLHNSYRKFGIHRIATKFVPRLLADDQKQNPVDVNQYFLDRDNEDFVLKIIITVDETWVYENDVETKVQLSQWMSKSRRGQIITPSSFTRQDDPDGIF